MTATTSRPDVDPALPPPQPGRDITADQQRQVEFRFHWGYAWSRFRRDRFASIGGIIAVMLIASAASAPLISPFDPMTQFPDGLSGDFAVPRPPGSDQFVLGTDSLGRDFLSRLIWGGRISSTVAVAANVVSITIAVTLGGIAGFLGGWADTAIKRGVDLALGFPALLLLIALATVLPPSSWTLVAVVTIFGCICDAHIPRSDLIVTGTPFRPRLGTMWFEQVLTPLCGSWHTRR